MVAVTSQSMASEQYSPLVLCGRVATHPGFPRIVPVDAYSPGIFTVPSHSQKSPLSFYLFIWLRWVLVAARGIFVEACRIFHYGMWAL